MAYVPGLPDAPSPNPLSGQQTQQEKPSQTNLLMAAATMEKLGSFKPKGKAQPKGPVR